MIDLLCLLEFYNTYDHDNVFYSVCEKMLHSFPDISEIGMQELADYLFISSSTLYRFVKMLAYDNYGQMRTSQQMFLENYMFQGRYLPVENSGAAKGTALGLKGYSEYLIRRIDQVAKEVDDEKISAILDQIRLSDEVIFIGMPLPSAVWRLQIELVLLGKKTSAFLNPQHQIEAVQNASDSALIFVIQYIPDNSSFYLNIVKEAKAQGQKTAAISNLALSSTLKYTDCSITFQGAMAESDMIMIEMLLNVIGNELNNEILEKHKP